ncbi:hypothetical protein P692DRAFT_20817902 [Suillus brevipes Sb2]|nr:hypothetical protein P692DRAFT_20817902 [Suillus brevipes Sb2]
MACGSAAITAEFSHEDTVKPIQLRYRFYTPPQALRAQLQTGIRLTSGRFVHHHFPVANPTGIESITGGRGGGEPAAAAIVGRGRFVTFDEHNSLAMGRTTVTGPDHRDIGTVAENTELSQYPQANLPPHSPVITSSDDTTPARNSAQQQESEGTTVPDEVYDAGGLSPLDSDANQAVMMWGDSRLETPFVVVNGMTVVPDRIDETVNGSELSPSHGDGCSTDDEWYHISQAVVAAARAASQLEHAEESRSLALAAAAMDSYIDWPDDDSDVEC